MPEPYPYKKGRGLRLSEAHTHGKLMLVECAHCSAKRHYFPDDLRRLLGDMAIDDLALKCEGCGKRDYTRVTGVHLTAQEKVGLQVRKLVAIKIREIPVWEDRRL